MDENEYKELASKLFRQALFEVGFRLSSFAFDATPNSMGRVMERFKELCKERGLDPVTMANCAEADGRS